MNKMSPDDAIDVIEEVLKRSGGTEHRWMAAKIVVALSRVGFLDDLNGALDSAVRIAMAVYYPGEAADE